MVDLKTLIDNLPSAIIVVNTEQKILLSNKLAKELSSLEEKDMHGKRGGDILGCIYSEEDSKGCGFSKFCSFCAAKQAVERSFAESRNIDRFETDMATHSMGARSFKMTVTFIRMDEIRKSENAVCVVTIDDMTEYKRNQRLAASIETFNAICHEMNQPLQTIIGNADLLTQSGLEDGANTRLAKVHSGIERLKTITNKLMSYIDYETTAHPYRNIPAIEKSAEYQNDTL